MSRAREENLSYHSNVFHGNMCVHILLVSQAPSIPEIRTLHCSKDTFFCCTLHTHREINESVNEYMHDVFIYTDTSVISDPPHVCS